MKILTTLRAATLKAIVGATVAGAAISLPVLAQASDANRYYNPGQECRKQEGDAKLVGGLLGAVAGGVLGSQVSGNGARTEGSVIGALLGGLAGAGIADESVDCNKKRRQRNTSTYYSGQTYGRSAPVRYTRTVTRDRTYNPTRRVRHSRAYSPRNNGYRNNRGYNNHVHNNNCRHDGYGSYNRSNNTYAQLEDVRYRLHDLRKESKRLTHQLHGRYDDRTQNRSDWVNKEIRRLERKKRRLNRRLRH